MKSHIVQKRESSLENTSGSGGDIVVLDVGGTSIRVGHMRNDVPCSEFDVLKSSLLRTDNAYGELVSIIRKYAHTHDLDPVAVVLGIPGMLEQELDLIEHCNNIHQLEGYGLRATLEKNLECKVILEQDIMLQLLGEYRSGAAKESASVFGVYYGTGIGAAYLLDGDPGLKKVAGIQAGHIPIVGQGKPCLCGNTDCVEAYACGHTLLEMAEAHGCAVSDVFLQRDNYELQQQIDTFVQYQSFLVATLGTLFVPEMILIGGGIPQMNGYPKDSLLQHIQAHLQKPYPCDSIEIAWASLGRFSVLHGAKALLEAS